MFEIQSPQRHKFRRDWSQQKNTCKSKIGQGEVSEVEKQIITGRKQLASRFNFTYRYIDDVLSINNPEFENNLGQMYPVELEIKETTESNTSASCLDLLLSIGRDGQLHASIYDKRDDFNFHITNVPFLSSNIPTPPAYGVFISQLSHLVLSHLGLAFVLMLRPFFPNLSCLLIFWVSNIPRYFYFAPYTVCPGLLLVWMFYPEGDATFK